MIGGIPSLATASGHAVLATLLLLVMLLLGVCGCQDGAATSSGDSPAATSPGESSATSPGVGDSTQTAAADPSATPGTASAGGPFKRHDSEKPPEPLLEDWSKPAVAIVLTGEQHGHLEPCGCSERQSGGLARRANFVQQLEKRGWPVVGFDLGGTLERTRRQSEMKFEFTRDALNIMGYKGLGLGLQDLRLGVLKLFEEHSRTGADDRFDVPFVSANVTFFGTREVGTPLPYRIVEVGGVKIGVTSIIGQSYLKELFPSGAEPDPAELLIEPPDDVLPDVIKQMQAEQPDVMILLSYAKHDESVQLATKYPEFPLVVTAGAPDDPLGEIEQVGETRLLEVGAKGKYAGLIGYYPNATPPFRFETVELDRFRFGSSPTMDERMRVYQLLLEEEDLVAKEPPVRHRAGKGYEFVGTEKCIACHEGDYDVWKETPHMHAIDSLTVAYAQASDDPSMAMRVRVDRIHDPECICCHTVGWDPQEVLRFESGFTGRKTTPHLEGVHCENCHGPASKHVALEQASADDALLAAERSKLHLSVDTAEIQVCAKCHDFENSPDFDFETYWSQIEHGGY